MATRRQLNRYGLEKYISERLSHASECWARQADKYYNLKEYFPQSSYKSILKWSLLQLYHVILNSANIVSFTQRLKHNIILSTNQSW